MPLALSADLSAAEREALRAMYTANLAYTKEFVDEMCNDPRVDLAKLLARVIDIMHYEKWLRELE